MFSGAGLLALIWDWREPSDYFLINWCLGKNVLHLNNLCVIVVHLYLSNTPNLKPPLHPLAEFAKGHKGYKVFSSAEVPLKLRGGKTQV